MAKMAANSKSIYNKKSTAEHLKQIKIESKQFDKISLPTDLLHPIPKVQIRKFNDGTLSTPSCRAPSASPFKASNYRDIPGPLSSSGAAVRDFPLFVCFAPNWIRWMLKKKSFVANLLNLKFKKAGYVFDSSVILHDIGEEEKGRLVWTHSERLALAFGLMKIPNGRPIRIIKNFRFCLDCHATIKLVSKLVQREIVVRDMNRFHHFDDGNCSCSDYW